MDEIAKAKVFISWSGSPSKEIAGALRRWLPRVFQTLEPFSSNEDVRAGDSWFARISDQVRESDFAIICVTATNKDKPWLHYEAGAVALSHPRDGVPPPTVMPYRVNVGTADIEPPLSMFQSVAADEEGTWRLLVAINERVPARLDAADLKETFDKWWPDLEVELAAIVKEADEPAPAPRDPADILEEVLAVVRELDRPRTPPRHRPWRPEIPSDRSGAPVDSDLPHWWPDEQRRQMEAVLQEWLLEVGVAAHPEVSDDGTVRLTVAPSTPSDDLSQLRKAIMRRFKVRGVRLQVHD